jgi:YYY domain-containing protein
VERSPLGIEVTAFWVLSWIITLKFLQLALWPLLKQAFHTVAYPVSFTASVLVFTLLTWYCGLAQIPLLLALIPFIVLLAWNLKRGMYRKDEIQENLQWDALFLTGFLFVLMIRLVNPSISSAEKFMDHAFLASIMREPIVPPLDPWLSGGTLTIYYYLGYWMFGALGLTSNIPSTVVFNLALPTVFGLTLVNGYLIGRLILDRMQWLPLLAFFLVNPSFIYLFIQGQDFSRLLWESSRTITSTINEYPLFSLIWGDVHPHIMGMFNQVFLLSLLAYAYRSWADLSRFPRVMVGGLIALSLGSMPLLNSWDVFVYAPLVVLFGILLWSRTRGERTPFSFLLAVPFVAVLLYLPYYLMMDTAGVRGISLVPLPSDPVQFLLVHGFFLALLVVVLRKDILARPYMLLLVIPFLLTGLSGAAIAAIPLIYLLARRRYTPAELFTLAGLIMIILPEIVYLKDSFGDPYYRMNTVFKFYFAAWILLGTGSLALLADEVKDTIRFRSPIRPRLAAAILAVLLVLSPLAMGMEVQNGGGTLDGMAYLRYAHPGDAAAITYLRSLQGPITLVEAENGDYNYYSRISSFTGIPAVIGWPYHEITWRGADARITQRMADVRVMYEQPNRTLILMDQYQVTYLYVGDTEREHYTINLPKEGLAPVYNQSGVVIYARAQ